MQLFQEVTQCKTEVICGFNKVYRVFQKQVFLNGIAISDYIFET